MSDGRAIRGAASAGRRRGSPRLRRRKWLRAAAMSVWVVVSVGVARADEPAHRPEYPVHRTAEPEAAPVTARTLMEDERFWPYHVGLVRAWRPEASEKPIPVGLNGVLIRVEADGAVLVDFGRDGIHRIPVDATDLVERANRVRRGEIDKLAPNFVRAIGPRLVDATAKEPGAFPIEQVGTRRFFLTVFADPRSDEFGEFARALAPLRATDELLTILVPDGHHRHDQLLEQLQSLDWPVPFVADHLAGPYARSLLGGADSPRPTVMLQTAEGRVLWSRSGPDSVSRGVSTEIEAALEQTRRVESQTSQPRRTHE